MLASIGERSMSWAQYWGQYKTIFCTLEGLDLWELLYKENSLYIAVDSLPVFVFVLSNPPKAPELIGRPHTCGLWSPRDDKTASSTSGNVLGNTSILWSSGTSTGTFYLVDKIEVCNIISSYIKFCSRLSSKRSEGPRPTRGSCSVTLFRVLLAE